MALALNIMTVYGTAFWSPLTGETLGGPIFLIILSIIGIIGGAIALAKTKAAGILMLVSGLVTPLIILLSSSSASFDIFVYLLAIILLVIGGILALVAASRAKAS
jgi:hypothetical protein